MAPFKITRYAAGTRSLTRKTTRRFPVTTSVAPLTYQVKDTKTRKWVTVCTMNADTATKTYKVLEARGRIHGKHFRTVVTKATR